MVAKFAGNACLNIGQLRRYRRCPVSGGTTPRRHGACGDGVANFLSQWRFRVEWGQCDPAGIVFNSRFFEFFDWGTWTLFARALGVKPADFAAAFGIVGIPVVDASARFLAPARFGDVVELASQIIEFRPASFEVEHRLMVHDALAVEGRETRIWAARDTDPPQIRAEPVPEAVIARLRTQ
jgi:4-hydroxybenzoyl-CoA thioesterase